MGEPLYRQVVGPEGLDRPCRIYAPVGTHDTLLAYLVRRLLENGANSSFVHRLADPTVPLAELVQDPVDAVEQLAARDGALGLPHPAVPLPTALYGVARANSLGVDLASDDHLGALFDSLRHSRASTGSPNRCSRVLGPQATTRRRPSPSSTPLTGVTPWAGCEKPTRPR